jgi:hypothetical protein
MFALPNDEELQAIAQEEATKIRKRKTADDIAYLKTKFDEYYLPSRQVVDRIDQSTTLSAIHPLPNGDYERHKSRQPKKKYNTKPEYIYEKNPERNIREVNEPYDADQPLFDLETLNKQRIIVPPPQPDRPYNTLTIHLLSGRNDPSKTFLYKSKEPAIIPNATPVYTKDMIPTVIEVEPPKIIYYFIHLKLNEPIPEKSVAHIKRYRDSVEVPMFKNALTDDYVERICKTLLALYAETSKLYYIYDADIPEDRKVTLHVDRVWGNIGLNLKELLCIFFKIGMEYLDADTFPKYDKEYFVISKSEWKLRFAHLVPHSDFYNRTYLTYLRLKLENLKSLLDKEMRQYYHELQEVNRSFDRAEDFFREKNDEFTLALNVLIECRYNGAYEIYKQHKKIIFKQMNKLAKKH